MCRIQKLNKQCLPFYLALYQFNLLVQAEYDKKYIPTLKESLIKCLIKEAKKRV